jgi:radical SAM superfamily enzyme YgiQ (UPF0313 family)
MASENYRVLLINPNSNQFYVPTASLGLSRIAATLPQHVAAQGMDLNVFKWIFGLDEPSILATIENYLQKAARFQALPDLIGLTVYQETLPQAVAIARLARRFGVNTVAGGIYPTLFPDRMPLDFDFLIRGAGERPFAQLVALLGGGACGCGDPAHDHGHSSHRHHRHEDETVAGLSLHPDGRTWVHTGPTAAPPEIEGPLPRRAIFDEFNMGFHYYSVRIQSSQGCPYACSFCANAQFARREWRPRPAAAVLAEVEAALEDPAVSEICFSDDQFLGFSPADYQRAYRILRAVEEISRRRNLRVNLQVRADHFVKALECQPELAGVIRSLSRNFIDYAAEVSRKIHGRPVRGFSLDIGVESFLDERLREFAKGLTAAENRLAVAKARQLEVDLGLYMILFTPEVTLEQIEREFASYLEVYLDSDIFSKTAFLGLFQELVPYQGTPVHRSLAEAGRLVAAGNFTGFRFADLRAAAFYVLYRYQLDSGALEPVEGRGALVGTIRTLLLRSRRLGEAEALRPLLAGVICAMTDRSELERVYGQLAAYEAGTI